MHLFGKKGKLGKACRAAGTRMGCTFVAVPSFSFPHPSDSRVKVAESEDCRHPSGIAGYYRAWSEEQLLLRRDASGKQRCSQWECVGHPHGVPMGLCAGSPGWGCGSPQGAAAQCCPWSQEPFNLVAHRTAGSGAEDCASDWNLKNFG